MKGKWFGDFLSPEDRLQFAKNFKRFWQNGEIHSIEFYLMNKKGDFIPVRYEGLIYSDEATHTQRTQCVFQDITLEKKHEAFYRSVFENSSTAYAIYAPINHGEDFKFVDFNAMGEKIEHVDRRDLIGKAVTECFPGIEKSPLLETFKRVYRSGVPEEVETFFYIDSHENGYRTNKVFKLPTGEIVANYHDSTELEVSKKMLESTFNLDRDIICTTLHGEEIIICNRSFLDFFGISELSEFKREHACICETFIEDPSKSYIGKEIEGMSWVEYVVKHQDHSIVKTRIRQNGNDVIFSLFAKRLKLDDKDRYLVILSDITLHETYQKELEEQVEQKTADIRQWLQTFEFAEKLTKFGVANIDLKSKTSICTGGISNIFIDLDDPSRLYEYVTTHLHPDDSEQITQQFEALMRHPEPYDMEYRIQTDEGESRCLIQVGGPSEDSQYLISIIRDVTGRKRLEQLEKEHEQALYREHKLKSLKEMFKLISHHWRQPLNVISMTVQNMDEYIDEKYKTDVKQMQDLVVKEVEFMSQTITHFSDFAKEDHEHQPFEIREVLEEEVAFFSPQLEELQITATVKGNAITYHGLKLEFMRIIHAIISNAIESIQKRKQSDLSFEGKIEIATKKAAQWVSVAIKDNGIGMSDETKSRVFEPYFTTKFQSRGVGLSLSICHDDIRQLFDGRISVNNQQKEGVTFLLEFPLEMT